MVLPSYCLNFTMTVVISMSFATLSAGALVVGFFEVLSVAPGNSGLYVGLPGAPRASDVTMRVSFWRNS